MTVGQFVYVIRKRIKLSPEKAIFIFVDEVLPPTAALMSSIYEEHKDEDGYVNIYFYFVLRLLCYHFSARLTNLNSQIPIHYILWREHVWQRMNDAQDRNMLTTFWLLEMMMI